MSDRVEIHGLRVLGRHGVLPEEHDRRQPFVIDVTIDADLTAAAESDDLATTVDYAEVAARVSAVVSGESHQLIERVAGRVCEEVLSDLRVRAVTVQVRKPHAATGLDVEWVGVEIERRR